jgi:curli biogenesis system outer membrane secretion channel CsgG
MEAEQIINAIKFNGCIIEWGMSDNFLSFLDMTIYHDANNCMQHMPYQKACSDSLIEE